MIKGVIPVAMALVMTGCSWSEVKEKESFASSNPSESQSESRELSEEKNTTEEELFMIDLLANACFSCMGDNPVEEKELEKLQEEIHPTTTVVKEVMPILLETVLSNDTYTIHSNPDDFMLGSIDATIEVSPRKMHDLSITTSEKLETITLSTNFNENIFKDYISISYMIDKRTGREYISLDRIIDEPNTCVLYSTYDIEKSELQLSEIMVRNDLIHVEIPKEMSHTLLNQMVKDYQNACSNGEIIYHFDQIRSGMIPTEKEYVKKI